MLDTNMNSLLDAEQHAVLALQMGIVEARVALSHKGDEIAKLQTRLSVLRWWERAAPWAGDGSSSTTDALAELAAIEAEASEVCEQRVALEQQLAAAVAEARAAGAEAAECEMRAARARAAAVEVAKQREHELEQLSLVAARLRGTRTVGARREQLRLAAARRSAQLGDAVKEAERVVAEQGTALAAALAERASAEEEARREDEWQAELLGLSRGAFGVGSGKTARRAAEAATKAARVPTAAAAAAAAAEANTTTRPAATSPARWSLEPPCPQPAFGTSNVEHLDPPTTDTMSLMRARRAVKISIISFQKL